MKIVFFSYAAVNHISGVDSWLKRLLPELASRGLEICVVFSTRGDVSSLDKIEFFKQKKIEVYTIALEKHPYAEQRTKIILSLLAKINPDVVVPGYIMPAIYAVKWLKLAGIPSVFVVHSDDSFYREIIKGFIAKKSDWRFDAAVGVSKYLTDELVKNASDDQVEPITNIPYGVLLPQNSACYNSTLNLVYVGRLEDEQKRITDVVSAFCKVVEMYPWVTASVYGDGSLKHSVINIIEQSQNSRVMYKGYIDSENIAAVLTQYQVIVLMSDYEGLPVSLLEGMSCGLVPVCLDMKSGISDAIENMSNGIIIQNRDSDFSTAIKMLKDKQLWQKLSVGARKTIEDRFSIQVTANSWENIFHELVKNKKTEKTTISQPKKISLPSPIHALEWENYHNPGFFIRGYKKVLRFFK